MFDQDNEDEPAMNLIESGVGKIDLNNIPGKKRAQMVANGDISIDSLTAPANMPGKKLAALRAAKNASIQEGIKQMTGNVENTYKTGDLVNYKGYETEVIEIDAEKGVKVAKKEGKTVWVHHTKVKSVKEPSEVD